MASIGRCAQLARSGVLVIALALPGAELSANAQPSVPSKATEASLKERAAARPEPQRGEHALPSRSAGLPARSAAASEPKPYAMLVAGLGLLVFIARRRTRALNAGR